GIVRSPGRRDRFVCTDNLTGWFEAFTHSATLGQGYMVRDSFVFRGWRSSIDGRPLDRNSKAETDTVFPWGHRVCYPDGTEEELVLHSGHRILSLRVTGPTQAPYSIEVDLEPLAEGLTCDRVDVPSDRGTTVHLVFAESADERRASLALVRAPRVWENEVERRWEGLTRAWLATDDEDYNRALFWAAASAQSFVTQEFGTGLWAGLPWFKDNWGRDTFITLPGALLCTGDFPTARAVLENFARYQNVDPKDRNRGRIPNRVNVHEILYNTVDGTPWLIRELEEYQRYTGDAKAAQALRPLVKRYVEGALATYVDAEGLMGHDDADTWMDARIAGNQPWSPRGNRAVEIQALWIEALEVGRRLADAAADTDEASWYGRLALQARGAFGRRFVVQGQLIDRVGVQNQPDPTLRPNALLLAWIHRDLPVDESILEATTKRLVEALLTPWGILSLDPSHPDFHPRHENPARWHKDAAYHNGTIWGWNAGFTVTALGRFGWQDHAWALTRELSRQILEEGCVGTLGELVDALPGADGRPVPTGTFSQAWSVSEFVRNAYQDYLGFHPDLPRGELRFLPSFPSAWTQVRARLPFGLEGQTLTVTVEVSPAEGGTYQAWSFDGSVPLPRLVVEGPTARGRARHVLEAGKTTGRLEVLVPSG
ncbi:MAG TPA: amylo-alpha-1,6-glucosidase, partial [Spirochaetia bacterium]|nr:amylo-alpha-1,6-glucosidase [Spirochaetia bacterium]